MTRSFFIRTHLARTTGVLAAALSVAATLSAASTLAACTENQDLGDPLDAATTPGTDSSANLDSPAPPDAPPDTGSTPPVDSGSPADAGAGDSAAPPQDSGAPGEDSAPAEDSGPPADAGCPATQTTQGTLLASNQPSPLRGLAIDTSNVYWTTFSASGIVGSVPKAGGTPGTLATAQAMPFDVLSDGTNLFWNTDGPSGATLMTAPVTGGTASTFYTFAEAIGFGTLASDGTNLYVAAEPGVWSFPLTGSSPNKLYALEPTGTTGPWAAVDATNVYTIGSPANPASSEQVLSLPKTATSQSTASVIWTAPATHSLQALIADATGLYWSDMGASPNGVTTPGTGSILALPAGASTVVTLASNVNQPVELASDGQDIYWNDPAGISRVPIGGGTPTLVVADSIVGNVRVDATDVYWTNTCFGTIKKIAK
jgi:hypothetical protein